MVGAVLMLLAATVFYFGLQSLPVTVLAVAYALMALCAGSGACWANRWCVPAPIRLSGMAATYDLSSALLGGLSLPLVAWLNVQVVWGAWLYLAALCVLFAVIGLGVSKTV